MILSTSFDLTHMDPVAFAVTFLVLHVELIEDLFALWSVGSSSNLVPGR